MSRNNVYGYTQYSDGMNMFILFCSSFVVVKIGGNQCFLHNIIDHLSTLSTSLCPH